MCGANRGASQRAFAGGVLIRESGSDASGGNLEDLTVRLVGRAAPQLLHQMVGQGAVRQRGLTAVRARQADLMGSLVIATCQKGDVAIDAGQPLRLRLGCTWKLLEITDMLDRPRIGRNGAQTLSEAISVQGGRVTAVKDDRYIRSAVGQAAQTATDAASGLGGQTKPDRRLRSQSSG